MSDAGLAPTSPESGRSWFRNSLAWRIVLPIPLAVALAIVAIWIFVPRLITANAIDEAVSDSQQTAAEFKTFRGYYTERVVNKVVKNGAMHVSFDHASDPKAIPLPATMIHDLSELLSKNDTTVGLYSKYPFPNRKDRTLDAFQQQAWDYLSANPTGDLHARGGAQRQARSCASRSPTSWSRRPASTATTASRARPRPTGRSATCAACWRSPR